MARLLVAITLRRRAIDLFQPRPQLLRAAAVIARTLEVGLNHEHLIPAGNRLVELLVAIEQHGLAMQIRYDGRVQFLEPRTRSSVVGVVLERLVEGRGRGDMVIHRDCGLAPIVGAFGRAWRLDGRVPRVRGIGIARGYAHLLTHLQARRLLDRVVASEKIEAVGVIEVALGQHGQ